MACNRLLILQFPMGRGSADSAPKKPRVQFFSYGREIPAKSFIEIWPLDTARLPNFFQQITAQGYKAQVRRRQAFECIDSCHFRGKGIDRP